MCSFPGAELPPPYPPPQAGEGREGGCGQQEVRDADPASEVDWSIRSPLRRDEVCIRPRRTPLRILWVLKRIRYNNKHTAMQGGDRHA
jgi:hypothetical protein